MRPTEIWKVRTYSFTARMLWSDLFVPRYHLKEEERRRENTQRGSIALREGQSFGLAEFMS